ncbi:MAG TPA: DUF3854 domain-containing protein [Pyrinomonadaceae bacterium]|nr:DUF3854 domain-containing protein [Pyrinomonadaceae bacterium]HMP64782.1 DUF3854 domain-containing protein [Pyrinomonadaceae bacterium]
MIGIGYKRVSRKRPCGICGKPDWCSTTATETISFCARSTLNADRISRDGWGVYYNLNSDVSFNRPFYRSPNQKKSTVSRIILASAILRDRIYRKLIELSPATHNYEIVNGRGGLRERGIGDYSQYGSLSKTVVGRTALVERLVKEVTKDFGRETASFAGIPGFWKDAAGEWRLWSRFDSNDDLMLIPFVGRDGLIQACQIRFMRYVENRSGNYLWLSSAREPMGCGPGSPLHHANPDSYSGKPVLVTEGALKAATVQKFLTERYVVGNGGVATSHREIVETARRRQLDIAFDNDSFTNPHVARAMAALIRLRHSDQNSFAYNEEVRIITWDGSLKGIDDALLAGVRLKHLTVAEWLKCLRPECLEHANQQLSSIGRKEAAGNWRHGPG